MVLSSIDDIFTHMCFSGRGKGLYKKGQKKIQFTFEILQKHSSRWLLSIRIWPSSPKVFHLYIPSRPFFFDPKFRPVLIGETSQDQEVIKYHSSKASQIYFALTWPFAMKAQKKGVDLGQYVDYKINTPKHDLSDYKNINVRVSVKEEKIRQQNHVIASLPSIDLDHLIYMEKKEKYFFQKVSIFRPQESFVLWFDECTR